MNYRSFVSLLIAFSITVILVTSILLFLIPYDKVTAAIHTTIGFIMLLFIVFHIINNWKSLKNYSKQKRKLPISNQFMLVFILILIIVTGLYLGYKPFWTIYDFGSEIKSQQNNKEVDIDNIEFQIIKPKLKIGNKDISIEVTKGTKNYMTIMAIWIEDLEGNFVETLYATKNIATGTFWQEIEGEWKRVSIRRPEGAPYWAHKRNIMESDGYKVPTPETKLVDAISGATPESHYILKTKISDSLRKFKVFYEVNRSFDWNDYYHENAFPNDPIYSGNGYVGQPSLIYSTSVIDTDTNRKSYLMSVRGHGHHSGETGELYTDLSNITTALDITDRVIVIIE